MNFCHRLFGDADGGEQVDEQCSLTRVPNLGAKYVSLQSLCLPVIERRQKVESARVMTWCSCALVAPPPLACHERRPAGAFIHPFKHLLLQQAN